MNLFFDALALVPARVDFWPFYKTARLHALLLHGREKTRFDCRVDCRYRLPQIKRYLRGPLASSLLPGFVQYQINQRLARFVIAHAKNLGRDLNQVRIEQALVPLAEGVCEFCGLHAKHAAKDVISLGY